MYVTSPVASVIAEFDVDNVIRASLPKLWEQTRNYAGIDEEFFWRYFAGNEIGYAIQVGSIREYASPFCPKEELGLSPPQSFVYLDSFDLEAHLT
jgi:predicted transcriptional regulator